MVPKLIVFPKSRLIKTNYFPEGPDISTFVICLELQQNIRRGQ